MKTDERFTFHVIIEELELLKEGDCPANTAKNTEWALRTLESWRAARNAKYTTDQCPSNLFGESLQKIYASGFVS